MRLTLISSLLAMYRRTQQSRRRQSWIFVTQRHLWRRMQMKILSKQKEISLTNGKCDKRIDRRAHGVSLRTMQLPMPRCWCWFSQWVQVGWGGVGGGERLISHNWSLIEAGCRTYSAWSVVGRRQKLVYWELDLYIAFPRWRMKTLCSSSLLSRIEHFLFNAVKVRCRF